MIPTELGIKVSDFLVKANFCFADLNFTASIEDKLDDIVNGKTDKLAVLTEFWTRLKSDLENAKVTKEENSITAFKCPKCNSPLLKKFSKWGQFFSCQNYKNKKTPCDYTAKIDKEGNPVEKIKTEIVESEHICSNCKEKLVIKISKKNNQYLSCRNWKDPKCAGFYGLDGKKMEFKKKSWGKKKWGKKKDNDELE